MGITLTYHIGFYFTLKSENGKFMSFYNSASKNGAEKIWVATIAQDYFFKEIGTDLQSLHLFTAGWDLAKPSLETSQKEIDNWELLYGGGLEIGEYCAICIPGYNYESNSADTSFSVVKKIAAEYPEITHGMSITDYAELVQTLFILRHGKYPQESSAPVHYYLPGGQITRTENSSSPTPQNTNPETEKPVDNDYKIPDKVKYFVVHQAGGNSQNLTESTINGWKAAGQKWRCHLYILNNCKLVWLVKFNEVATGTKQETIKNKFLKGQMIHVEQCYYSKVKDIPYNTHNPAEGPPEAMYNKLAEIYAKVTYTNKRKLIIIPHREVDRGITVPDSGHNDPWNFDFDKLYKILETKYEIKINQGTEGITQERYRYWNGREHKVHYTWPPPLSGKPEKD
ncbi:MAG: N-acetylmuramoyl-L-alanine amidase [Spirochaetales bacterium]|nr:N-acetylmuramoyl-L-alanine amidase [Spirochaetales bacterium]